METSYVTLKEAGTKRKHLAFVRAKLATAVAIGIQKNIPTSSEHLGLKSEADFHLLQHDSHQLFQSYFWKKYNSLAKPYVLSSWKHMKTHLSRGKHMLKCFAGKNNYFSCRLQVTEEANSSAGCVQGKNREEKHK